MTHELKNNLKNYSLLDIDIEEIHEAVHEEQTMRLELPGVLSKNIYYKESNILSPQYIATKSTSAGKIPIVLPRKRNYILYEVKTNKEIGRLNINEEQVTYLIFEKETSFYIRKISTIIPSEKKSDIYILYEASDSELEEVVALCKHHGTVPSRPNEKVETSISKMMNPCYVIEVAVEADYEFYQKYSSSVPQSLQRMIDQFNLVEGIYFNSGIGLSWAIVYLNVWTVIGDPYVEGERFAMRNEFKTVWNDVDNGFTDIDRDIAYMISGKVGTSGGAAFISTAGDPEDAYAVGQEFDSDTDQHLIAHEIGHTLSASHDTVNCVPGNKPMSSTMCSNVGTMGFKASSVTEIFDYLNSNSDLFLQNENLTTLIIPNIDNIRSWAVSKNLTITATIIPPGYVRAIAGRSITLPPGFRARSGSYFNASINPNMDACQ